MNKILFAIFLMFPFFVFAENINEGTCTGVDESQLDLYSKCVDYFCNKNKSLVDSEVNKIIAYDPSRKDFLLSTQNHWYMYVENHCAMSSPKYSGGSGYVYSRACLAHKYELRLGEVKAINPANKVNVLLNLLLDKKEVRYAYLLKAQFTDNGADGYLYLDVLEERLPELLTLMEEKDVGPIVAELLAGSEMSRGGYVACQMRSDSRRKIVDVLARSKRNSSYSNDDYGSIISNIEKCE